MKSSSVSLCLGFFLLVVAAALSGCASGVVFPDVGVTSTSTSSLGKIQGNNYGGHAPLVGAHVFVLQADPAATGYYQASKSLLDTDTALPTESAGTAVSGHRYVTTDTSGNFNITGDYTCDANYPVYLYAEGGNPNSPPAGSPTTIPVTGATISGTGPYTITFTVTGPSLLYQGESITLAGGGGTFGNFINGATLTVLGDANLTTTTFDVSVASLTHNGVTVTTGTQNSIGTVTLNQTTAPNNPAVVNLAVLGVCPSSGNFTYLGYVYVNEVSTVAAAYALGGFFPAPGTTGLAVAGASAANLSVPSGDALALKGLQNAALTAGQIYDVQGSNQSCAITSPTCDGDTHIARTTTPGIPVQGTTTGGSPTITGVSNTAGLVAGTTITGSNLPAGETIAAIGTDTITLSTGTGVTAGTASRFFAGAGSGTVPQALIDTMGNILANCVDSANTSSTASPQCSALFSHTLSAGTSGTQPVDTATAAIDMAHNPWANVTTLINSPTGNVPFSPYLSSANDLSVGISYTPANVGSPQGIAVDGSGNVWYTNASSGYVTTLTPTGGVLYNVHNGVPTYIAIDGNGTAWFGNVSDSSLYKLSSAGVLGGPYDTGNLNQPYGIAVDGTNGTGYIYVDQVTVPQEVYKLNGNGTLAGTNPVAGAASCLGGSWDADHLATDNNANGFNLWISSENGDFVCVVNSAGALVRKVTINATQGAGVGYSPEFIAIDANGNAWVPTQLGNTMNKITSTGTLSTVTGGTLSSPFGAAVDGAGNAFVANRTGNSLTEFLGSTSAAVSATNFYGGGNAKMFSDPLNVAIDPSGFIWTTNYTGNKIVQVLGVAAPTYTPLSLASYYNKLGSKP